MYLEDERVELLETLELDDVGRAELIVATLLLGRALETLLDELEELRDEVLGCNADTNDERDEEEIERLDETPLLLDVEADTELERVLPEREPNDAL